MPNFGGSVKLTQIELTQAEKNLLDEISRLAENNGSEIIFHHALSSIQNVKVGDRPITEYCFRRAKERLVKLGILKIVSKSPGTRVPTVYGIYLKDKEIVVAEKKKGRKTPRKRKIEAQSEQPTEEHVEVLPAEHPIEKTNDILLIIKQQLAFRKGQVLLKEAELEKVKAEAKALEDAISALEKVLPFI